MNISEIGTKLRMDKWLCLCKSVECNLVSIPIDGLLQTLENYYVIIYLWRHPANLCQHKEHLMFIHVQSIYNLF